MRLTVFGGTTEGRELVSALVTEGHDITVSVATAAGADELTGIRGISVVSGRKEADGMTELVKGRDLCVDATHPYAVEAGRNIRRACLDTGVKYVRLLREFSDSLPEYDRITYVPDARAAVLEALRIGGNILLATGVKELPFFEGIERHRLFVRILPVEESLEKCISFGIPARNIIAMYGPFSKDLNEALIKQYKISCMVTKDGGVNGGFEEKIEAARSSGIGVIVIKRPTEQGIGLEEIIKMINTSKICT
ncbi:MAG: precorrin-6A reductase [Lachnospiraceae bacterium]|nr:precorrin-6A reductase [Lachnospiraceae bacterium]